MLRITITTVLVALFLSFVQESNVGLYASHRGNVKFVSKAPLETIMAESNKLKGAIDASKKTFHFIIPVNSFEGFNSPLQKEHFNENYLETERIPTAVFKGKIIEDVNLLQSGTYQVRAKGIMNIHNVEKEMLVKARIISTATTLLVECNFSVVLNDFNIKIPKVVQQKIAEQINVDVKMELATKK